jgi:hypothetical protein
MAATLEMAKDKDAELAQNRGANSIQLPTFLGIGSMRCGSTWLYEALKCHPDIQLSKAKELDFFFLPKMLKRDLHWYVSRFQSGESELPKRVRGEISPLYARLKQWQVHRVAELLPNARIILTLRHPIDRVWSQAVYEFGFRRGEDVRRMSTQEFLRQVERPRSMLSSDYSRTIEIWSKAFGREALHIDFFNRIQEDPEAYLNDILRHLGLPTPWKVPAELVKTKVWATNSLVQHEREIPELVEWYIADRLLEPTQRLNHLLDGRASAWVNELRAIRGRIRPGWRILSELNRLLLSLPERLAYESYHAVLDARLWWRWRQLRQS